QILPIIGHAGLIDSKGRTHDFGGDFTINIDKWTFGSVTRYYELDLTKIPKNKNNFKPEDIVDDAIKQANQFFSQTNHNLFTNNCHHHAAMALNVMKYDNKTNWNQVSVAKMAVIHGKQYR
ncbi:MAG: hypothetical protein MHPSP_002181, partial [Paramarteilia canceri]